MEIPAITATECEANLNKEVFHYKTIESYAFVMLDGLVVHLEEGKILSIYHSESVGLTGSRIVWDKNYCRFVGFNTKRKILKQENYELGRIEYLISRAGQYGITVTPLHRDGWAAIGGVAFNDLYLPDIKKFTEYLCL